MRNILRGSVILLVLACTPPASTETFPYSVSLDTRFGSPPGPLSFAERLENNLFYEMQRRACFERIVLAREGGAEDIDFVLEVRIHDFMEQVIYDASIAERATSVDPTTKRRLFAEIAAKVLARLVHRGDVVVVRSVKSSTLNRAHPAYGGQDEDFAREEVRRQALEQLVEETARKICKGSAKKLDRQLEKARTDAVEGVESR